MASPAEPMLPRLPDLQDAEQLRASFFFSQNANWLVPRRVLLGGYPGSPPPVDELALMRSLRLQAAVDTFVCLQAEVPAEHFGASPPVQLAGSIACEFRPYVADARALNAGRPPQFIHFPMVDHSVASSLEALDGLIIDLARRVRQGEVLYIHCMAGLGRTGLVAACLLGRQQKPPWQN